MDDDWMNGVANFLSSILSGQVRVGSYMYIYRIGGVYAACP